MKSGKTGGYKISPEISWRQVGDEAVLLNTRTSAYYSLNPVGVRLWDMIARGADAKEMAADLVREYGISEAAASKDVADLLKSLKDEKIITAG
ncbi:MAG: PqqD family protein [Elusimicrobia bacterium]|nr:PqqD family protein [Elusimicrobiota bacterium]